MGSEMCIRDSTNRTLMHQNVQNFLSIFKKSPNLPVLAFITLTVVRGSLLHFVGFLLTLKVHTFYGLHENSFTEIGLLD